MEELVERIIAQSWHESFRHLRRGIENDASRCRGRDIDIHPRVWELFESRVTRYVRRAIDAHSRVDVRVMFRCDDYRDVVSVAVSVSFDRRDFGFGWIYSNLMAMFDSDGLIRRMTGMARLERPRFENDASLYDDDPRPIDHHHLAALYSQLPSFDPPSEREARLKSVAQFMRVSDEKPKNPGLMAVEKLVAIVRSVGEAMALHLASALSLRGFVEWGTSSTADQGRVLRSIYPSGVCAIHGRVPSVYSLTSSSSTRVCSKCQERRGQATQAVELLRSILAGVGDALALRLASSLSLRGYVEWSSGQATSSGAGRVAKPIGVGIGLWGMCPRHGLVVSDTFEGERVCSKCDRCRKAVRVLFAIIRVALEARTQRARQAVDWLVSTVLLCGHILWESLSDWQQRCLMLESGGATETIADWERRRTMFSTGPRQPEGVVEPEIEDGLRFALLELD